MIPGLLGRAAVHVPPDRQRAEVHGNLARGFSCADGGEFSFAAGASVSVCDLLGSDHDLSGLGLGTKFNNSYIGALRARHGRGSGDSGRDREFSLIEQLANFRGGGDAIVACWFVLGVCGGGNG